VKLLALSPWPRVASEGSGGIKRPWHLLNGLARHGIEPTLWTMDPYSETISPSPEAVPDEIYPARVLNGRPRSGMASKMRALASASPEEIWMRPADKTLSHAELTEFDAALLLGPAVAELVPLLRAAELPVVLDAHDVPDRLQGRIARIMNGRVARTRTLLDARKWQYTQKRLADQCDLVVAVSEEDADVFRRSSRTPVVVRPNGVAVEKYAFVDHSHPAAARLLFTATFSYFPNMDATRWLIDEIVPQLQTARADISLDLVGQKAPAGPLPRGVRAAADVPFIQPWFDRSDVFVAPLRAGTGTRLKIIEAFAKGLPCVSSSVGCEGLPVQDGVHLLIADTTQTVVAAVLRLLGDQALRRRLTANARQLAEEQLDWAHIANAYARDLWGVAKAQPRTAAPALDVPA
jgi:glycosyltransferase involved in cell wall biosynthesis